MFWRFGFHNASSIDSLLDKEDVVLESILDEDDLLQECKSQNTRLIDYFQRIDVLQRLFSYVTGDIEGEEKGRFKYPYVATEVLCSDIWSIVETSVNCSEELLKPFWDTVLKRSVEDMKTEVALVSRFTRINTVFLNKKPVEMFAFIRNQRNIVDRLLMHIGTPSIVDLLVRVIQLDEQTSVAGVLEWFASEHLLSRLLKMLAPSYPPETHVVVSDLIKGIISLAAPSPGAGVADSQPNALASNQFARELAQRDVLSLLISYIVDSHHSLTVSARAFSRGEALDEDGDSETAHITARVSSIVSALSVIIELIRKNNSDYFEPYLFHTLRNRLIQVQQQLPAQTGNDRETLEHAMNEMVSRVGVVHLGALLELLCGNMVTFQSILKDPKPTVTMFTTVGVVRPLGFQRYRVCELYAELIHCSNMSLLNRPPELNSLYDPDGCLQGGLVALEKLARIVTVGAGGSLGDDSMHDIPNDEIQPAMELPISSGIQDMSSSMDLDVDISDEDADNSSDDDVVASVNDLTTVTVDLTPASPSHASLDLTVPQKRKSSSSTSDVGRPPTRPRSSGSRRSSKVLDGLLNTTRDAIPPGDLLKRRFIELNAFQTVLDLFFEFRWNNFLHSVTYDMIHQTVTGRTDLGANRELIISLFKDARLLYRIVEGQERDDVESALPKASRLGYMGHLTLITEDVITALNHYPADLQAVLAQYTPQPAWDTYVNGVYAETKRKDNALLGGGKPVLTSSSSLASGQRWKVDEEDTGVVATAAKGAYPADGNAEGMRGEFRRATSNRTRREGSADFGSTPRGFEDDFAAAPQFARYLAQEMSSVETNTGSSSDEDDDEEDGGWLTQSRLDISAPPLPGASEHLASDTSNFEDAFIPSRSHLDGPLSPNSDDDDAFGPFSDAAAASGSDPFMFSHHDEAEDISFDSFGDFGEFQESRTGEMTPTGSWTFASRASFDSDGDGGSDGGEGHWEGVGGSEPGTPLKDRLRHISLDEEKRT